MGSEMQAQGVRAAERWLEKEGYTVGEAPDNFDGKAPDVYGIRGVGVDDASLSEVAVQVETCASARLEAALEQMEVLADWARKEPWRKTVLFVQQECVDEAAANLPDYDSVEGF